MQADWKDIGTAPRGRFETRNTGKGETQVHIPQKVMTGRVGDPDTRPSYYIPSEDRWNGYTKEAGPTHWDDMPEGPTGLEF